MVESMPDEIEDDRTEDMISTPPKKNEAIL